MQSLCRNDDQLSGSFRRIKFLVLDEADKLLDVAFEEDLRRILSHLPAKRQTLLFSATMTKSLVRLQQAALKDAYVYKVCISASTEDFVGWEEILGIFRSQNCELP